MQISAVCLVLNLIIVVPLIFAFPRGHQAGALGVANVISSLVNVALLSYALKRKMPKWRFAPLVKPLIGMLLSAGTAGVFAWFLHAEWMTRIGNETVLFKIGEVFTPSIAAALVYWGITSAIGVREARDFVSLVRNRRSRDLSLIHI